MTKNILFIYSWIFFIIWIFTNNLTQDYKTSLLVLLILVVLFLCYFLIKRKYIILLLLSLLSFCIWILISINNLNTIKNNLTTIEKYYKKDIYINFQIKSINKITNKNIEYTALVQKINKEKIKNHIYAIIKTDLNTKLQKWNIIKTKTKIYELKNFNWFAYKDYMLSKNIYFSSNIYEYQIIWQDNINFIETSIIKFRKKILESIYKIYPKEEAIFLWWILIWARESLPNKLKQDFNNSWLTHFIAVSWFNITIIIIFITFVIQYFPTWLKSIIITCSIILFTILVWDTAPVIRASIMWLIWYYILMSWRKWNIFAIVILTIILMIIYSPLSLNYDVSLHLSFLAVLWIIFTQKFFENIFSFLPNILEIKTAFTLTMSALIFTLPIMIFNFGQVSILAPISNIAVTWTIPLAMIFGFLSILVHFVYPMWWIIIWYITWIFLKWNIMVVHFFWNLEWSLIKFNLWNYSTHIEILYFVILLFIIIWFRKKEVN
jgi:competence protein ComEC